jgi:hypothetical protein
MCVCVCARVCARVRARVCVCVYECTRVCVPRVSLDVKLVTHVRTLFFKLKPFSSSDRK